MKLLIPLLLISLAAISNSYAMEGTALPSSIRMDPSDLMEQQIKHNNLFLAFRAKNLRGIEEFINRTKDITQQICYLDPDNPTEFKSQTLLDLACEFNIPEAILRLRATANERNIDIDLPDEEGNTVLARAAIRSSVESETVGALLAENKINTQNKAGKTPLHLFLSQKKDPTTKKLSLNLVKLKLLCKNGANIEIQDLSGNTSIHYALKIDPQGRILQRMLENSSCDIKLCINTQNEQYATPLHFALESFFNKKKLEDEEKINCLNTIAFLCENGARIDIQDAIGNSPLHYALERDPQGEVLRVMRAYNALEADQFINVQNNDDATPLHIAIDSYLNAQELNPKEDANCLQTIEELLELGADLTIPNAAEITPLHMIRTAAALEDECAQKLRAQKLNAFLEDFATNETTSPRTRAARFAGVKDDNSVWGYFKSMVSQDE